MSDLRVIPSDLANELITLTKTNQMVWSIKGDDYTAEYSHKFYRYNERENRIFINDEVYIAEFVLSQYIRMNYTESQNPNKAENATHRFIRILKKYVEDDKVEQAYKELQGIYRLS
jgi:hypothetical protein